MCAMKIQILTDHVTTLTNYEADLIKCRYASKVDSFVYVEFLEVLRVYQNYA